MKQSLLKILYKFLAFCSRIYIKKNKIFSIGITGSVGKTTCRTIISQVLEKFSEQRIYTSPKNYNSELGLIFSIFQIEDYVPSFKNLLILSVKIFFTSLFWKKKYDVIVLEYWIDRPNDMDFLVSVNRPDIAIFTKLDYTHSEFFGWREAVLDEKFKMIYSSQQKAYVNSADDLAREKAQSPLLTSPNGRGITVEYFWREEDCKNYELIKKNNWVFVKFETFWKVITTNAIGEANMYYINLALRVLEDIEKRFLGQMHNIKGQTHRSAPTKDSVGVNLCVHPKLKNIHLELSWQKARFAILQGINNSILVDSTYNAWPESMKKIIEDTQVLQQNLYRDYKIWYCLWDMREIWPTSWELHKEIYTLINSSDLIVCSNPEMMENFWEKAHKFKTSREAWKFLKNFLEKTNDKYLILFKWSQNTVFMEEALIQVLENKADEHKLCRQEDFWKQTKQEYFESLEK